MTMTKTFKICFCGIMIALATALSFVKLFEMPLGGSITLCRMLPILLVGYFLGVKWGLATSIVYAAICLLLDLGSISGYGMTPWALVGVVFFDYVISFGGLGLAGIFRSAFHRERELAGGRVGLYYLVGMIFAVFIRFVGGVLSGATVFAVWSQWTNPLLYSICYNGAYLLVDLAICLVVAVFLYRPLKKLFHIPAGA